MSGRQAVGKPELIVPYAARGYQLHGLNTLNLEVPSSMLQTILPKP